MSMHQLRRRGWFGGQLTAVGCRAAKGLGRKVTKTFEGLKVDWSMLQKPPRLTSNDTPQGACHASHLCLAAALPSPVAVTPCPGSSSSSSKPYENIQRN